MSVLIPGSTKTHLFGIPEIADIFFFHLVLFKSSKIEIRGREGKKSQVEIARRFACTGPVGNR
jgi:hypothetical protein